MFKNMAALISEPGVRRNIGKNLGKFIQRSYNSIKNLRSVLDYNAIKLKIPRMMIELCGRIFDDLNSNSSYQYNSW